MLRSTVLLLACIFAAVSASKISVSPTTVTIQKNGHQFVNFRLNEPIICPPDAAAECAVVIVLTNPDAKKIALDNCIIKWTAEEWHQTRTLKISALENFINEAGYEVKIVTEVVETAAEYYKDENPADITVKTAPRKSAHCSGTGDPHYTTFDRLYWHVYTAGYYVLYANKAENFEVQVATRAYPARHCAFAAREDNDIFVVNACSGRILYDLRCGSVACKRGQWPKIQMAGGRSGTYAVTFRSGRYVRASTSPYYMNMYATAPGRDYKAGVTGICGNFDGIASNDSPCGGCKLHDLSKLKPGQKANGNLFSWRPSGPLVGEPLPPHVEECTYVPPEFIRPILTQPDIEDVTDLLQDIIAAEDEEEILVFDLTEGSTPAPMEESKAREYCENLFSISAAARNCQEAIPNFKITPYIEDCVEDLVLTNNVDFAEGSIQDLQLECAGIAESNTTTWETDNDGNPIKPNEGVASTVCPNDCSGHGTCANATCTCEEGFTEFDCSVNKAEAPTVDALSKPFCDTQDSTKCPKEIVVYGDNFWAAGETLKCVFTVTQSPEEHIVDQGHVFITAAAYLGSSEVLCYVPPLDGNHQGETNIVANVQVQTLEGVLTEPLTFTWFDGVCNVCTKGDGCGTNPSSCNIDNKCVREGVHDFDNVCRICHPLTSTSTWTYNYANSHECGPKFQNPSVSAKIVAEAKADVDLHCVDARNSLVQGDGDNSVTYTMSAGDPEYFKVVSVNGKGCVQAVKDFTVSQASGFDNLVGIDAEDSAGNVASVSVIFDLVATNEDPAFAEEGYNFTIAEDAAVGTEIGQVVAVDKDSDPNFSKLTYTWTSQPEGHQGVIAIDESTGKITVAKPLDFETYHAYHMLLQVKDNGGQFHITSVTVYVEDVPEPPTAIHLNNSQVDENEPVGTRVGYLTSEDPEGGDHTYSVVSEEFGVDGHWLVTKKSFNYEKEQNVYTIEVTSTDSTGLSFTTDLQVDIADVNEAPTNIRLSQTTFSEDVEVGEPLAVVTFEDEDNEGRSDADKQTVRCTLIHSANFTFYIDQSSAQPQLVAAKKLDFEKTPSYTISIGCADDAIPLGEGRATIDITIVDAKDPPQDVKIVEPEPVLEDVEPGQVVATISAKDYDLDASDITFSIDSDQFSLENDGNCEQGNNFLECTISIVLEKPLDYESGSVVEIPVTATDSTGASSVTNVKLNVGNVNEPPTGVSWNLGYGSVVEGLAPGSLVGEIKADDPDKNQLYTFTLMSHTDLFELVDGEESIVAKLKLKEGAELDHETQASIDISVSVADDGEPSLTATGQLTLTVEDMPLTVVFQGGESSTSIHETAEPGTSVGTLEFVGNDQPAKYNYVMAVQEARREAGFKVVSNGDGTYNLVVMKPLDAETEENIAVEISAYAEDKTTGQQVYSHVSQLTVVVDDVDEPPMFTSSSYKASLTMSDATGTALEMSPSFGAVDEDGSSIVVTYSFDASSDADLGASLAINDETGVITLAGLLSKNKNVKAGKTYTLVVKATSSNDGTGVDALSSTAIIRVSVDDSIASPGASSGDSNSSSSATLIGVIVGVLCVLLLAAVIAFFVVRNRQPRNDFFEAGPGKKTSQFDNPTFQAPDAAYASISNAPTFVPGCSNPMYEWYAPDMSRQECTEELAAAAPGTFLVRDSKATPGWHILGVKTETDVLHEKIRTTDDGTYQLLPTNGGEQPRFRDLPGLVNHYGSVQPGLPFVLDTSSLMNPMYAMGAQNNSATYGHTGVALPNDPAAPIVPLKEREVGQVAQLAGADSQDIYSNTEEAKAVIHGTSA